VINCNAGYEFWLAQEAVERNPNIKLYGLTWAAPCWVGSSMYSQNGIQYILDWLGCARQRGLTFDYMGGWNEKGSWSTAWWKDLRTALDQHGFATVKLVASDQTWQSNIQTPYPYAVGGGLAWSNYQVSADVRNAQPGSVGIPGRQSNLGGTEEDPSPCTTTRSRSAIPAPGRSISRTAPGRPPRR
jgi:hypothetical protein